ncbi:MAG: hypothetical protein K6B41_10325 [Butyrivibrio sp.]|nr:hypothetical protein [Butyrivibrio sp.]
MANSEINEYDSFARENRIDQAIYDAEKEFAETGEYVDADVAFAELEKNHLNPVKKLKGESFLEDYYGKPYDEITFEDLGPGGELDWGEDVGGEVW